MGELMKWWLVFGLLSLELFIFGCVTTSTKILGSAGASCTNANDCQEGLVCLNNRCSTKPISSCYLQSPGFTCFEYKLVANTTSESGIILELGQATGHDIAILGFNCTTSETYVVYDFTNRNVTIPSATHKLLNGNSTEPLPLPCFKEDGTRISAQDAGQYYKGMVYIHYVDLETGWDHKLVGQIQGKIE